MKKTVILAAALALAIGVDTFAQNKSAIIEKVLVRVNGEIFTQTQLEQQQIEAVREKNPKIQDARALQDDATLRGMLAEVTPAILVGVVEELLLVQRGRELGAKFTDDVFKRYYDNIKAQNKLDDEGMKQAMAQGGMTIESLRQRIEREYLRQATVQQEILRNMNITEAESRAYYKANPDKFMTPATVTLREIFVAVPATTTVTGQPGFNVGAENAAREKIEGARTRALKGEDIVKIISEVSDSGSKANGGLIGPVKLDDISPSLRELIEKLKAGEFTEPVRTTTGFQMFKVETRSAPEVQPFDKVRGEIGQQIQDSRLDGETDKLLERLRGQALIEWKDDAYKQIYEKALAAKKAAGQP